jgi:very-short-patch-repair endonuclease
MSKQHGLIARRQALHLGMTPRTVQRRTATGEWRVVRRGVFANPATPSTEEQDLLAHVLAAGPHAVATSLSSAWLWGLSQRPSEAFVLMQGTSARSIKGAQVRLCTAIPKVDRTFRRSVPVTSVDRTIIESARDANEEQLSMILEEALRQKLTRVDRLEKRLRDLNPKGRRGARCLQRLLRALADGEPPTESELESAFLRICRRAGLSPSRQVWVSDTDVIGRVDFAFAECKVVVEVDGHRWHSMKADVERDRVKEARLSAEGWVTLRFTWDQVQKDPATIVAALKRVLADRAPVVQGVLLPNRVGTSR